MNIPPFIPSKTRRHSGRRSEDTLPPAPPGLVVTEINDLEYDPSYAAMTVFFNVPEGQEMADPVDSYAGKWSARINGINYIGTSLQLAGTNSIQVNFSDNGSGPGANELSYSADPSDISTTDGLMLGAFSGFPI